MERKPRKSGTYEKVDLTRPVNADKVMSKDVELYGDSCFGKEWSPEEKACSVCHDQEMCGLVFHNNQRKTVAAWEAVNPPTLDKHNLDTFDKQEMLEWVKKAPRSFKDFVEYVYDRANIADKTTVVYWCKSYILDSPVLTASKGMVYYEQN